MEKQFKRCNWEQYKEMLERFNYTEEQIENVAMKRNTLEVMEWDMYQELLKQGILVRTRKLKKPRSLYVCEEGKLWYLCHYRKDWQWCSKFKEE